MRQKQTKHELISAQFLAPITGQYPVYSTQCWAVIGADEWVETN